MTYFYVNRPEMTKKFLDFREESASQTTTKIVKCWRQKHKKARGKASPSWGLRFASPPTSHGACFASPPTSLGASPPILGGFAPQTPLPHPSLSTTSPHSMGWCPAHGGEQAHGPWATSTWLSMLQVCMFACMEPTPCAQPSIPPALHGASMGGDILVGHGWRNAQGIHHTMMFACFKGLFIPKGWWNLV